MMGIIFHYLGIMNERSPVNSKETYSIGDYVNASFYPLLIRLPKELIQTHIAIIENRGMSDSEAEEYLKDILEKRGEALTETEISDLVMKSLLIDPTNRDAVMRQMETTVFLSESIGAGQTARVKRFDLPAGDSTVQMAIKYLITPTAKTLSAAAEHDMLREVERIKTIEEIEEQAHVKLVHVPHPYFHHKNEHIQCYGMQYIDGVTFHEIIDGEVNAELVEDLQKSLSSIPESEIYKDFDRFFDEMHTYCLHGDIKPRNIMVSRSGTFYVIDFGQSILVNDLSDKEREQLDNLKDAEVEGTRMAVRAFLKKLFSLKQ